MTQDKKQPICRILTVDDQMGIDSFFYEFFTARNYEVLNALSGKEAIEIVKKHKPRIVLLDINMRGMDGIETLKRIKEIDKDVSVIMVTGVKDEDVEKKARELGADDYITKPLSLEYLDKVVLLKVVNLQLRDLSRDVNNI
jgi:two-component system, response regulator, stage 0 sporulation protein F